MREIKFRAWDSANKEMFQVRTLQWDSTGTPALPSFVEGPIMQFTGLLDKNGLTDIYEGDIIDDIGIVRGNIYESPSLFREGIDLVVTGMGTET